MSNILNGKPLEGISVGPNKFQGCTTLDQLEDYGLDQPSVVEQLKKVDTKHDRHNLAAKNLRDGIQRTFDKGRRLRADVYSAYLEKLEVQKTIDGGCPAATIFLPDEKAYVTEDGRTLAVPYNSLLVAIDGETQMEARFLLRKRVPESGANPMAVTIYHGLPSSTAQQIMHDYNVYPHPVSEKMLASVNHTGPLSRAISDACLKAGMSITDLNRKGNVSNKKTVASYSQVMAAVTGYVMNGQALSAGAAKWFKELNLPASEIVINKATIDFTTDLLLEAKKTPEVGKLNGLIWQVSGAVAAQGRSVSSLNWDDALDAYDKTRMPGRGGERTPIADRLKAMADAI